MDDSILSSMCMYVITFWVPDPYKSRLTGSCYSQYFNELNNNLIPDVAGSYLFR